MEEKKETVVEEKKNPFFGFLDKFGHFILAGLGLLAIAALFLPILKVGNGSINLIEYFVGHYKYGWSMYLTVALLALAIAFAFLKMVNKYFLSFSTFAFILAEAMLALTKAFFKLNDLAKPKVAVGLVLSLVLTGLAALVGGVISANNAVKRHKKMKEQERSWENGK